MNTEQQLRQLLLPVFGLTTVDEVPPDASLVNDLGAVSLDFVQIVYLVEKEFGVILKTNAILTGSVSGNPDDLFKDGKLTAEGAALLNQRLPGRLCAFTAGLGKADLFGTVTVRDLARVIDGKLAEGPPHA
jgi:acyl carrier protein